MKITFFSELIEQLKPSVIVLLAQVIKEVFAQGADYVHEFFTLKRKVEMSGGIPQTVGYVFHPQAGWKIDKVVDLTKIEGAELDKTTGVVDISFVETSTHKIVRIENMQYFLVQDSEQ